MLGVHCRGGASWSPDGRWLYDLACTDDPGRTRVERVSVDDLDAPPEMVREDCGAMLIASDGGTGSLRQITDFGRRSTMIARQVAWARDSKGIFAALMEFDADIVLIEGAFE